MENIFSHLKANRKPDHSVKVVSYKARLILFVASLAILTSFLVGLSVYFVWSTGPKSNPGSSFFNHLSNFTFGQIKIQKATPTPQPFPAQPTLKPEQKQELKENLEKDGVVDTLPQSLREEMLQLLK